MPNDGGAGTWESGLAERFGRAVAGRRLRLLLTAASLAERTKKLGYPMTPTAIGRIESNDRAGRIDVAELFVLAAALEIPPVLLLFPGFPDGSEEVLPGVTGASDSAVRWFSGTDGLPGPVDDESDRGLYATSGANAGIALVELVNEMRQRKVDEFGLEIEVGSDTDAMRAEDARRRIAEIRQRLAELPTEIDDGVKELWDG